MLTILAGVATWEREIMLERQRKGIAKAKAAGKYKGRPVSIDAAHIRQLRAELGPAAIAKRRRTHPSGEQSQASNCRQRSWSAAVGTVAAKSALNDTELTASCS